MLFIDGMKLFSQKYAFLFLSFAFSFMLSAQAEKEITRKLIFILIVSFML